MQGDNRTTIFVDAHCLDKGYHGTHTFIRELYQEILERYPKLDVYFGTYEPLLLRKVFPDLDDSRILPYKRIRPTFFRFFYDIPRLIRKYHFDYVHFQYIGVPWKTTSRTIVTLHDILYEDYPSEFPLLYRLARKWVFAGSMHRADIKTTVSAYSRRRIANRYHIPEEEIHVIPNAVDIRLPLVYPSRDEARKRILDAYGVENFILYVSRMEPRKNQLLLLQKYLSLGLHREGIALVFIGAHSQNIPGWQRANRNLTPEERRLVHWLPQVGQEDLAAFYTACRLFIYPSKAEGFGIPPLEAAICGAPVLCSRGTAMEQFQFFNPYTFDPCCGQEFEEKLFHIIHHPPAEAFLEGVSDCVTRQFSRAESARAFYSIINTSRKTCSYQSAL